MIKRTSDKFWFPWWPEKWLWGSIRIECTIEERAIWVDLLCIAAKDDGHIRANEETPYPIEQLAGLLVVPKETLASAIEKFINLKDKDGKGKLTRTKEGTLYVTKWEDYQFSGRWKREIEKNGSEKTEQCSKKKNPIINNNTLNNNKKNNIKTKSSDVEKEFNLLWPIWPKEGRFDKKHCLMKLGAIIKQGKLELFKKVTNGYLQFLEHKAVNENFPQKAKHLKTWMNNWEDEREMYENFKYETPL